MLTTLDSETYVYIRLASLGSPLHDCGLLITPRILSGANRETRYVLVAQALC